MDMHIIYYSLSYDQLLLSTAVQQLYVFPNPNPNPNKWT